MQNQTPQETPDSEQGNGPKTPPRRKLLFTLALLLIVIGMYVGTYYKITQYGP